MFCKGKTYMGSGEDWTALFFPLAFCVATGASHGRVVDDPGAVPWLWEIGISGGTTVSDTKVSPKRPCNVSTKSSSSWSCSMIVVNITTVSERTADLSDASPACASIAEITSSFVVSVCMPFLHQISAVASCCTCLLILSPTKRIAGKSRWGRVAWIYFTLWKAWVFTTKNMHHDAACFPSEFLFLSNFFLSYSLTVRSKTVMLEVCRTNYMLKGVNSQG